MAQFTADLQSFRPSFPFLDIDPNMEIINQLTGMTSNVLDNSNLYLQSLIPFNDGFWVPPESEFRENLEGINFSGIVHHVNHNALPVSLPVVPSENEIQEIKKRKTMDLPETSSANSTPQVSESAGSKIKSNCGRGKRAKSNVTEEEKPKEVVHVRARRGQATDSHSLAERVRRGKINEKLKCLQNIVPGCYKTMGMAVMLDEIINYVQSLQHQVEFLSMKLTAASSYYDFNSETDTLETMQRRRASEAKELGKYVREGYGEVTCYQPSWAL
ncbi:hypothetical protein L6164_008024 [Bauhinia variegata]|uniref:Uncharacterized protein n=1 Tax=Bauhinia variegata TaxID=167791 RepID=A0ACB9PF48_BAUVA|nr:hypothetical protein L6164_008024 [Bauhinia variegata]